MSTMPSYARAIVSRVADENGVRVADLLGPSHQRRFAWPRQAAYARLRDRGMPFEKIGHVFERHWTTIIHGDRVHRARGALLFLCIMARWAA